MEQTDYNKIAPLRVAARPGASLDEFNVYYQAFKNKTGIVKVKLTSSERKLPSNHLKAVAEMKAFEFLLAGLEILSEGRTGDTVQLTATSRAVKEVMQINQLSVPMRNKLLSEAKTLKYIKGTNIPLAAYYAMCKFMPTVIARFLKATIIISDDVKWINPVVPEKNIHWHISSHKIMQRVDITGIGKIAITNHAFEQFVNRHKSHSVETQWDDFLSTLRQPTLKQIELTPEIKEYNLKKYGLLNRHYYDSESRWNFIVVEDDGELVLVTSVLTVNTNDYTDYRKNR